MAVTGQWSLQLSANKPSSKKVGPFHAPRLVVVEQHSSEKAVVTQVKFTHAGVDTVQQIVSSSDSVAAECNAFEITCQSQEDTRVLGAWSAEH